VTALLKFAEAFIVCLVIGVTLISGVALLIHSLFAH
jgi:hypothetical protein